MDQCLSRRPLGPKMYVWMLCLEDYIIFFSETPGTYDNVFALALLHVQLSCMCFLDFFAGLTEAQLGYPQIWRASLMCSCYFSFPSVFVGACSSQWCKVCVLVGGESQTVGTDICKQISCKLQVNRHCRLNCSLSLCTTLENYLQSYKQCNSYLSIFHQNHSVYIFCSILVQKIILKSTNRKMAYCIFSASLKRQVSRTGY